MRVIVKIKKRKRRGYGKRVARKIHKFRSQFFYLENNQKLISIRYKSTRVVKCIFNSLASVNIGIKHLKSYIIIIIYTYLSKVINKLITCNYIFSLLMFKKPQEKQLKQIVGRWAIANNIVNLINWNWRRCLWFYDFAVVYYRKSTLFGAGFTKLSTLSSNSRHVYYTRKQIVKIVGKASRINYYSILFINTKFGILNHLEALKIKCGGNLLFRIE